MSKLKKGLRRIMENQVVTYEEVAAYQAKYGVATYAENSGGYTTGGIYVEWTSEGGFTGCGWQIDIPDSPLADKTPEEIQNEIDNNGNLNDSFKNWVDTVDYETRYRWILDSVSDNCRHEITT